MLIHYVKKQSERILVPGLGTLSVSLPNLTTPVENVCVWVESAAVGNYTATPTLNGQDLTALALVGVVVTTPQLAQLPGILPIGMVPGVKVVNNAATPLVVVVNIVARSMGA